ncbi:MAG: hypothetical protein ACXWWK_07030 [Gemmatimonadales bacterium]
MALVAMIGCDERSAPDPSATQPSAAAGSDIKLAPWKESYAASGTIAPGGRCPSSQLLVSLAGGGTATHVGKYTIVNSHCVDPETGELTAGTFVKTAANGDRIEGTYTGGSTVIQPPPSAIFSITGTIEFDGGTGRFSGATGTATMNGTLRADFSDPSFVPADVELVMIGSISSPGSTKQ